MKCQAVLKAPGISPERERELEVDKKESIFLVLDHI